ncbi:S24/S26 family peptidase [Candidatus Micrarchaeota archaeon]|nr:S24/S26 family peptidase [Candidatus Micrarchaeota archaeon]
MSLKNLEKVKVLYGNDMQPSIDPKETLLVDRTVEPKIGDVILFENRYGMRIAHRLLHKCAGYYFTKGDNCRFFNFPFKKDKVLGVVVGKEMPVIKNRVGEFFILLFLPYFILYSKAFDLKKKKHFFLLKAASIFYPYLPTVERMNAHG